MIRRISKYDLLEQIGSGGSKTVWRAKDIFQGREVALKLINRRTARLDRAGISLEDLLRREAALLTKLEHRNIVRIFNADIGIVDGKEQYLIAEEFVNGRTLADLLSERALNNEEIVTIGHQIAAALNYVHGQGIFHGDLKPDNVLLTPTGEAKITDFGLGRTSDEELPFGSIMAQAPELHEGQFDARSEVYAVGIILYEMATRKNPLITAEFREKYTQLRSQEFRETVHRALKEGIDTRVRIHNPKVSRGLENIIQRCLAQDPARRFQSMKELEGALWWEKEKHSILGRTVGGLALAALCLSSLWILTRPAPYQDALLFTAQDGHDQEIYSIDWGSKRKKQLTTNEGDDRAIVAHPRGGLFLWEQRVEGQRDILEMDMYGEKRVSVTAGRHDEHSVVYAPSGDRILYLAEWGQDRAVMTCERIDGRWTNHVRIYTPQGDIKRLGLGPENQPLLLEDGILKSAGSSEGPGRWYTVLSNCDDFCIAGNTLYVSSQGILYKIDQAQVPLEVAILGNPIETWEQAQRVCAIPPHARLSVHAGGEGLIVVENDETQLLVHLQDKKTIPVPAGERFIGSVAGSLLFVARASEGAQTTINYLGRNKKEGTINIPGATEIKALPWDGKIER